MGLLEDARNIQRKDPAARSVLEVILLYPGFHILVYHRIAHWLFEHKHFFLARWVSQRGRHKTGIEIHPGAKIGSCLFIDHGMGIVFGETAEIGDNCTIYHGVTLGGTGKDTGKRHPTLGNNVLIGAGTKVLGPVYIGDNARIGAGSVVLKNLPANCTAVGVPAEVVRINNKAINPADDLDQQDLPDIMAQRLIDLDRRIGQLEKAAQGDIPPTPQQVAVADVLRGVNMFRAEGIDVPVLGIIENMAWFTPAELPNNRYYLFGKGGARNMARTEGIDFLGDIPIVQSVMEGGENGTPAVSIHPEVKKYYREIADKIVEKLEKTDR